MSTHRQQFADERSSPSGLVLFLFTPGDFVRLMYPYSLGGEESWTVFSRRGFSHECKRKASQLRGMEMGPGSRGEARRQKKCCLCLLVGAPLVVASCGSPRSDIDRDSREQAASVICPAWLLLNVFWEPRNRPSLTTQRQALGADRWERPGEGRVMYTNPRRGTGGGPNDSNAGCRFSWAQG